MSQADFRVRRATVDDLEGLVALWVLMKYPLAELERRLTDFQVVETADGQLAGVLGLEIVDRQGRLHSEAFADFGLADAMRRQLAERMQALAVSHGLARLWTQETAPFWRQAGLEAVNVEVLDRLPAEWRGLPGSWLTVQLRDEETIQVTLERELARFREVEKAETARTLGRAKTFKIVVTVLALVLCAVVLALCFNLLRNRSLLPGAHQ